MNILYHIGLFAILSRFCDASKFNISLSNLATCEEYNIKSKGYTYADFFQVNSLKNARTNDNQRLHLKFYVMTSMDAHILLSETDNPRKSDRVYEIVLGAGGNTFSAIRSMMSRDRVSTILADDLLSVFDPMPVEIIQTNDGVLLVNIPGFAEPHLKYSDDSPLNIRFLSFSSYGSISAKWFYDCQFDGFFGEMEMENRPMSNEERLRADVLNMSEADIPPPNVTEIAFTFKVRSVEFDQRSCILSTRLHLIMNWTDSRISWDPESYGGLKFIVQPLFGIWHPVLSIEDGALDTFKKFHPFYSIKIDFTGNITMLARNAELHSWCFDVTKDWPNDVTNCDIVVGIVDNNIKLVYDILSPLTETVNELSEWAVEQISVIYATYERRAHETESNKSTVRAYLESIEGDLKIKMTISRNSRFYHSIFTTPALVAELLILLAFCLERARRGGLILVALIVVSLGLMFIARHAPAITVPDIVLVYEILMGTSTANFILHTITIWFDLYPPKSKPNDFLLKVINSGALRFVLAMKFEDSAAYIDAQEYPWNQLIQILNRLSFIVLFVLFISMNCMI
ncbi:acetylcholine receptor-like protein cup-4 [Episyrphus balteatus]|uniref:acetylcholine receptor-like protein cup-4 n=1 Tax=Episyrphus balteatus TaxID=286459 RepID=UPI0024862F95|nr:acetylcholine receptor-like protein cup-4 [Episyrphus balteatus]